MSEFDLDFASKLAELANTAIDESWTKYASRHAAVYLSRLTCEIASKALLEAAGVPVKEIAKRRHDIPVDPSLLAAAAAKFCEWAQLFHWRIRLKPATDNKLAEK